MTLIFDAHLDLAWNALGWSRDLTQSLEAINARESTWGDHPARGRATTCLPEMRRGEVAVCLGVILARTRPESPVAEGILRLSPDYPSPAMTYAAGRAHLAYYQWLARQSHVVLIGSAAQLRQHWQRWQKAPSPRPAPGVILAMEGADPIVRPDQAAEWWKAGLRVVSLVHYGQGPYAAGTGHRGPLTPAGIELLGQFQRLGIILDLTHLAEPGCSQALDCFDGPVMASHNNCRALVPGDRQFSDRQLRKLIARDAVIGIAADAWMLHANWQRGRTPRSAVSIAAMADHIDHVCQLSGTARHVGLGSDLDGGYGREQTPAGLDTIADLQKLGDILSSRGFSDSDIQAIFHGNWLRFFATHLPP